MVSHRGRRMARALRMHPSGILLVVQLIGVLIYPFMETTGRRVAFEAFGALVLTLAVWSVRTSAGRVSSIIAITLGVIASGLSITDAVHHSLGMQLAAALFHAAFYFWAAGNLMGYMLADNRVTTDELFAVGATFTLVAWAFAYVFSILEALQPGCFIAAVNSDDRRTWVELLFLSFTNLSSTGLSDIIPVTAQSRAVVMIEQLAGLGYVALFVSRLVGLQMSRHMVKAAGAGPGEDGQTRDADKPMTVAARQTDVGLGEQKADG